MKKLFLCLPTLLACGVGWAQIRFDVAAPTAVEAGEPFRIEFNINSLGVEFTAPAIDGFEVLAGPQESTGRSISIVNGARTQSENTTFTYVIRSQTPGIHTIGAAKATVGGKTYSSKPVAIEVVDGGSSGAAGASNGGADGSAGGSVSGAKNGGAEISSDDVMLRAIISRSEVYKGEPVVVTLKFYRRIYADLEDLKLPAFDGFWQQDISPVQPTPQRETFNGRAYDTWVLKEYLLYPQQSGNLTVGSFQVAVKAVFQAPGAASSRNLFDEFFGGTPNVREVRKNVVSQPVKVTVRDWPAGAPDSFDGAVGEFTLEATPPNGAISANQSGTYTLRLSGVGNFPLIRAPRLALPQSFENYDVKSSDQTRNTRTGISGYKEFSYPFIPRSDGMYTIAPFEFSYFDPRLRQYVTRSSREVSIEVTADTTAVAGLPGGVVSGISRDDLRVFGQDIQFIKRGSAGLHPRGRTFMFSGWYFAILAILAAIFGALLIILPRYMRNMQSDSFVRGKRANKLALKRFRTAETSMKSDDRHGFYDEMLKALWGYMSDKFNVPMADLTKERIREELFVRNIPEAQSVEYVRIISECEEAQYSPVASSRMAEIYREGVTLVSELESAINRS